MNRRHFLTLNQVCLNFVVGGWRIRTSLCRIRKEDSVDSIHSCNLLYALYIYMQGSIAFSLTCACTDKQHGWCQHSCNMNDHMITCVSILLMSLATNKAHYSLAPVSLSWLIIAVSLLIHAHSRRSALHRAFLGIGNGIRLRDCYLWDRIVGGYSSWFVKCVCITLRPTKMRYRRSCIAVHTLVQRNDFVSWLHAAHIFNFNKLYVMLIWCWFDVWMLLEHTL